MLPSIVIARQEEQVATVDDRSRHELYLGLERTIGTENSDTLMALLPPVGWADVATKQDLALLEARLEARLLARLDERMSEFTRTFFVSLLTMLAAFTALVVGLIAQLR